jgi:hypothetical protein
MVIYGGVPEGIPGRGLVLGRTRRTPRAGVYVMARVGAEHRDLVVLGIVRRVWCLLSAEHSPAVAVASERGLRKRPTGGDQAGARSAGDEGPATANLLGELVDIHGYDSTRVAIASSTEIPSSGRQILLPLRIL